MIKFLYFTDKARCRSQHAFKTWQPESRCQEIKSPPKQSLSFT